MLTLNERLQGIQSVLLCSERKPCSAGAPQLVTDSILSVKPCVQTNQWNVDSLLLLAYKIKYSFLALRHFWQKPPSYRYRKLFFLTNKLRVELVRVAIFSSVMFRCYWIHSRIFLMCLCWLESFVALLIKLSVISDVRCLQAIP